MWVYGNLKVWRYGRDLFFEYEGGRIAMRVVRDEARLTYWRDDELVGEAVVSAEPAVIASVIRVALWPTIAPTTPEASRYPLDSRRRATRGMYYSIARCRWTLLIQLRAKRAVRGFAFSPRRSLRE